MSYNNIGKVWTNESFGQYLKTLKKPDWIKRVCLHHCSAPSLAQRPQGFKAQHLENLKSFYQGLGWSKGPHFFIDEDQIWGMTPPTEKGIHSVGWNSTAIGIEALGDYDNEDPKSGRGLEVWKTTAKTTAELLKWLSLPANKDTVTLHRLDKHTSKSCPGNKVSHDWIVDMVKEELGGKNPVLKVVDQLETFVPVAKTLAEKGYSDFEIKKNLRRSGKDFFWLDDHLEYAYYDPKLGETIAPLSELNAIPSNEYCRALDSGRIF